jgi:hypothetical protein
MLCQLVCVDRRYQRMNCFNIRELQGILKRKFFTDLITTNDHRDLLNQTLIGLRYKTNINNTINPDYNVFYNYGTTIIPKNKNMIFNNNYNYLLLDNFNSYNSFISLNNFIFYYNINIIIKEFFIYFKNKIINI